MKKNKKTYGDHHRKMGPHFGIFSSFFVQFELTFSFSYLYAFLTSRYQRSRRRPIPVPGESGPTPPGGLNDEELMESPAVPNQQLAGIPEHKH